MSDEPDLETTLKRRRQELSVYEEESRRMGDRDLPFRWRTVVNVYKPEDARRLGAADYPRLERLFEIVREDGRVKFMLNYDIENPDPDFTNPGQRRQVEAILGFEQPLAHLIVEVGNRWRAGDFEGEAALLEEYAKSNPQRDSILDLAAEARRDALSGASARSMPKRR